MLYLELKSCPQERNTKITHKPDTKTQNTVNKVLRLHGTIRFSIDGNVDISSPNSKTIRTYKIHQTCLILKFHHRRLVSINHIYMFTNSIQHYVPLH